MAALPGATDVLVIGGGPAGLAAAIAARRRGFDVTLADCAEPPIDKACGEGVMPDGIAAARALGIDLRCRRPPFQGIRFHEGGASVEAPFPKVLAWVSAARLCIASWWIAPLKRACASSGTPASRAWTPRLLAGGRLVRARWIVGADGGQSSVRRWSGLDACRRDSRRYGFRRHYRVAPWSEFMEIHWGDGCQLYITPVSAAEVCVVLISRDPRLRLDDVLPQFPEVARRLAAADPSTPERGGVSASRVLRSVCGGRVRCGRRLRLGGRHYRRRPLPAFPAGRGLADALAAGDLRLYQAAHRRIGQRPAFMAGLMLLIGSSPRLRRRAIRAMAPAAPLRAHAGHARRRAFSLSFRNQWLGPRLADADSMTPSIAHRFLAFSFSPP